MLGKFPMVMSPKNGLVKFNRNVEKDIFGYFCLSFLNEDGEISEKNVRHVFSKFGEVASVVCNQRRRSATVTFRCGLVWGLVGKRCCGATGVVVVWWWCGGVVVVVVGVWW